MVSCTLNERYELVGRPLVSLQGQFASETVSQEVAELITLALGDRDTTLAFTAEDKSLINKVLLWLRPKCVLSI